jgi:hypothetical protein
MKTEFNNWWNKDLLTEDNPYVEGTPAFWAWEGWLAGVKAERDACVKLAYDIDPVWESVAEAIRARGRDATA